MSQNKSIRNRELDGERERVEGKGPRRVACSSRRRPEQSRRGSQVQSEREREEQNSKMGVISNSTNRMPLSAAIAKWGVDLRRGAE